MGVTINVQVNPAMSGWLVELYYLYGSEWFFFYDKRTDSKGKVALAAAASYYPVSLKVRIPAQTMDGIAYKAQEHEKSYNEGDVEALTFDMKQKQVEIPTPITATVSIVLPIAIGLGVATLWRK
jgi:hypothetical protein